MEPAFSYIYYDRLSDDLYYLGNSTVVRFNVSLGRVNENDGTKVSYHKEFMYPSNKYSNFDDQITMRRSFSYYLTIEKIDAREASIMIRVQDILLLRAKLHEALNWFNDNTFGIKQQRLYVVNRPKSIIIDNLPDNKYISLDPIVIEWENTGDQQQGIRLSFSEGSVYADISIDKFYGFVYTIDTLNMYESAQLLLNYFGRPDYGTNLIRFENNQYLTDHTNVQQEPEHIQSKNRTVSYPNRPKSFFDKIDEL